MRRLSLIILILTFCLTSAHAARWQRTPEGKAGVDATASDGIDNDGNGLIDDASSADDAFVTSGTGYLALAKDFLVVPPAQLIDDASVTGGKVLLFGGDSPSTSGMAMACGTFSAADVKFWSNLKVTTQRTNTLWFQVDNTAAPTVDNSFAYIPLGNQTSATQTWDVVGEVGSNLSYKQRRPAATPRVYTLTAARHCISLWGQTGVRVAAIGATAGDAPSDFLAATPVLSSISSGTPTATSATITWTSDIAADTQVIYSTDTNYGQSSPLVTALVTSHSVSLAGLLPDTLYHFKVRSRSGDGVLTTSADQTLTTATAATTGTIAIVTVGENDSTSMAPAVSVQIDALTPATRTTTTSGLGAGTHVVKIEDVPGLVPKYGTCTYNEGESACTVSSFPSSPTCDGTSCTANVSVTNGIVTKVAFRDVSGPREGNTASLIGGKNGTVVTVASVNDLQTALETTYKNGNVYIVFSSAGPFTLSRNLVLTGTHITIDCYTAPGHEVTFANYGFTLSLIDQVAGEHATGDIIIQGCHIAKNRYISGGGDNDTNALRITDSPTTIYSGTGVVDGVLLHHNSFTGCVDSCISLERKAQNIDLVSNIITDTVSGVPSLAIVDRNEGIGVYGNVFLAPRAVTHQFVEKTAGTMSSTVHIANNLFGEYQSAGGQFNTIRLRQGAKTRINDNTFLPLANNSSLGTINLDGNVTVAAHGAKLNNSIIVCNPTARWVSGSLAEEVYCPNSSLQSGGVYYNAVTSTYIRDNSYQFGACSTCAAAVVAPGNLSTTATAPIVPSVTLTDAATSACRDFQHAGPSPRSSLETSLLNQFVISNCAGAAQPAFDFTIAVANSSLPVTQGTSATMQVSLGLVSGTTAPVALTYSGLPANVTASYSATSCSPACSSTLTLTAASNATLGNATITATGTAGEVVHSATFTLVVSAPTAATPLGFWKMDEGTGTSLADSSGNGNTLTLVNGPAWVTNPTAVSFDGTNDIAQRTALSSVITAAKTITAWVYYGGTQASDGWIAGNPQEAQLYVQKSTGKLCYWDNGNSPTPLCSTGSITPNTWTFVAVKSNGSAPQTVQLRIGSAITDGTLGAAPPLTGNLKWAIGGIPDLATSRPLNARIRYVRLYNSALSDSALNDLSNEVIQVVPTVATPTFSPGAGNYPPATYPSGVAVTISTATANATIYYTTDGSTPTTSSTPYSSPVGVDGGTTLLKAIATRDTYQNSEVGSANYTFITPPACNTGISDAPCAPATIGRTLIVDKTNGPGTNYTSIQEAADASQPGDTIQIKNGTYNEFVAILISGTREQPITYMAYPGHTPILYNEGLSFPGRSTTMVHVAASWLIFDGLEFSAPGMTNVSFYFEGGNAPVQGSNQSPLGHITIRNCYFHDAGLMGIYSQGVSEFLIEKNRFVNNGRGSITRCTNNSDWGTNAAHCHGIYFGKPGGEAAIALSNKDYLDCLMPVQHITVRKNIFKLSAGSGVQIIANRCYLHNYGPNLFENNVFIDNPAGSYFWNQTGTIVRNNTFYVKQSYSLFPVTPYASLLYQFDHDNVFTNNVTYLSYYPAQPIASLDNVNTSEILSHNAFYTNSNDTALVWYWDNLTLSNFPLTYKPRTGDSTAILTSITSNNGVAAGFVNAPNEDFHLLFTSPLRNAGDNVTDRCASEDFDGNLRTDGQCDIGAFEYH